MEVCRQVNRPARDGGPRTVSQKPSERSKRPATEGRKPRTGRHILAILAALFLSACADKPPENSLLAEQFERIAFSSELGGQGRRGRLVKWVTPIRVWIPKSDEGHFTGEVNQRLKWIRAITGHDIALAPPTQGSGNLHIRFVTREQVQKTTGQNAPCATQVITRAGVIHWATISIAPESEDLTAHCLTEELIQAMGLLDDSTLIEDSLFNDASTRPNIPIGDAVLLFTLYDPNLLPGMPQAQAMPIARQIIERKARQFR